MRPISILEATDFGIVLEYGDDEARDLAFTQALQKIAQLEDAQPVTRYDLAEAGVADEEARWSAV